MTMRPAYTIDHEHGCIFEKWSGVVAAHDIIAFNRELAQDPDHRLGLNRLIDMRGARLEALSNEIDEIATEAIKTRDAGEGHRKAAIPVARDLEYGLVRMLNAMSDLTQSEVRPFRRLDEAVAWLGLPETLGDPFERNSN